MTIVYKDPIFDIDQLVMKKSIIVAFDIDDAWKVDDYEIGEPKNGKGTWVYCLSNHKQETIKLPESEVTELVSPRQHYSLERGKIYIKTDYSHLCK